MEPALCLCVLASQQSENPHYVYVYWILNLVRILFLCYVHWILNQVRILPHSMCVVDSQPSENPALYYVYWILNQVRILPYVMCIGFSAK